MTHTNHIAMAWFPERGGIIELQWNPRFERITAPFTDSARSVVRAGQLQLERVTCWSSRPTTAGRYPGSALITGGGFWNGSQQSTKIGLLFRPSYHLTFDVALQRNDISLPLPMHDFVTNLVTSRIGYAFNTRTFVDTLLQYNTDLKTAQREHPVRSDSPAAERPVRGLQRAAPDRPAHPINTGRGLIVKYTHMLAF